LLIFLLGLGHRLLGFIQPPYIESSHTGVYGIVIFYAIKLLSIDSVFIINGRRDCCMVMGEKLEFSFPASDLLYR
jgi:hypothetical protein